MDRQSGNGKPRSRVPTDEDLAGWSPHGDDDRPMPVRANAEAERKVLASLLVDPKQIDAALSTLEPRDMLDPFHRGMFAAMDRLHRDGKPIDPALLRESMKNAPSGPEWDAGYVGRLLLETSTAAHLVHYMGIVKDYSVRRQALDLLDHIDNRLREDVPCAEVLLSAARDMSNIAKGTVAEDFESITCAELDDHDEQATYIVEGVVTEQEPHIWAGVKKGLKTSLAVSQALAVATGEKWLGRFATLSRKVGFMSGESGKTTLRGIMRRVCRTMGDGGINPRDVAKLILSTKLPKLGDAKSMMALRRWIERHGIEVLYVDCAYLCMPSQDAANLFAMGALLASIAEVCQDAGCTLILLHHTRKTGTASPYAPVELEQIAFAGFQEFARSWILIGRRARYEPGTGQHQLWMTTGGSAGHGGLFALDVDEGQFTATGGRKWEVSIQDASEAVDQAKTEKANAKAERQAQQEADDHRKLVEALKRFPDGETKTRLKDTAGLTSARFAKALRSVLKDHLAEPCRITKNNRDEDAYKPTQHAVGNGRERSGKPVGNPGVEGEGAVVVGKVSLPIGERPSDRPTDHLECDDQTSDDDGDDRPETFPTDYSTYDPEVGF